MRRLFRMIALAFAALWLPATLHCNLATALSVELDHCERGSDNHAPGNTDPFDADHCDVVEGGAYRAMAVAIIPAPTGLATVLGDLFAAAAPRVILRGAPTDLLPPELARTWQFRGRAALPPRAPSLAS